MKTQIPIKAPAHRAWHVIGTQFGEISTWASSIMSSSLDGELGTGTTRTCTGPDFGPFSNRSFQEKLVEFEPEEMMFRYVGTGEQPWFLHSAENRWWVEPDGLESCVIHSHAKVRLHMLARPLGPVFRILFRKTLRDFGEELCYHIEQDTPHPRKKRVMQT